MARTILIVDDNDAFRGMLGSALLERGYQVIVARCGPDGLAAANYVVDAVLADVDMPEMDGFEFCRRLRDECSREGREVPVWIMTGALQLGLSKRGDAAGAKLVMRKPFNVDEICEQFERAFREREQRASGLTQN